MDSRVDCIGFAALLPDQQRFWIAFERTARELAGRLQALKGACLGGEAGGDPQGLGSRTHSQVKSTAGLANLALVERAQHRGIRQRLPICSGWRERQKQYCARVAGGG